MATFTLSAWVSGDRLRHHRQRDHFGAESAHHVVIDDPLGDWAAGTPVFFVIQGVWERLLRLESMHHSVRVMRLDAMVLVPGTPFETEPGTFQNAARLDALAQALIAGELALDAYVKVGGQAALTLDAIVSGTEAFTLSAFVV